MKAISSFFVFLFVVQSIFAQKPKLIIPTGHTYPVVSITIDMDNKYLATADQSSEIKVWDIESSTELYPLIGHADGVNDVSFSPRNRLLASAGIDKKVILWDLQRVAKQSELVGHTDAVSRVVFSADGSFVISSSFDGKILIWNTASGALLREIVVGSPIHSFSISEGEQFLACGTRTGELALFNFQSGAKIKSVVLTAAINDVRFSKDGKQLVVADNAGKIILVDGSTLAVSKSIQAFAIRAYKIEFTNNPTIFMAVGRDPKKNYAFYSLNGEPVQTDLKLDEEGVAGFETGINAVLFSKSKYFLPNYSSCIRAYSVDDNKLSGNFCGKAKQIVSCSIDESGRFLAIASTRPEVLILDLTGATDARLIKAGKGTVQSLSFYPNQKKLVTASDDGNLRIWDTESWAPSATYPIDRMYSGSPINFDSLGMFYKKSTESGIDFYSPDKSKDGRIKLKNVFDYKISPDGKQLVTKSPNALNFYETAKVGKPTKITLTGVNGYAFGYNNNLYAIDGERIHIINSISKKEVNSFSLTTGVGSNNIEVLPQKNWIVTWNTSSGKFGASQDYSLNLWNAKSGKLISSFAGHGGAITSVEFIKDKFMLTSSLDGTIKVWSLDENIQSPLKATVIPLDETNWVVSTDIGLFDATSNAMNGLHYLKGSEFVNIDQLKQSYYEPSLLPKILGYNQEPIRTATELNELSLYPEISLLHPSLNNGKLGITLTDQGGGYGQVTILINDKETVNDLTQVTPIEKYSPEVSLSYSVAGHPNLKEGDLNKISVKAYNKSGNLVSRPKNVYLLPQGNKKTTPKLYALLVGISDYAGNQLDLKFAAKDAKDMADALDISGTQYIGKDNLEIKLLTTDNKDPRFRPTKPNIVRMLELFAKTSTANDILFVYLSGHGVNYGDPDPDFFYLTADAQDGSLADETIRKSVAISSTEFTQMIKKIPAVKQVMIIDACHSGQLLGNIAKSQNTMSSSQIRAIETMKDKTGLYVLAGSAANAVSYETNMYGQGVLTYSLLYGMKGPALRENEFVDIMKLFLFAVDKVPQLANSIGGIQKPEMRIPSEAVSFDIGKLTETERSKITLVEPKPVFIRSDFQEESELYDVLDITAEVDGQLKLKAGGGSGAIDFVDARKFFGGFSLRGRYSKKETSLTAKIKLFKDDKPFYEYEVTAETPNALTEKIVNEALQKSLAK
jgi:WD40 repeat protein